MVFAKITLGLSVGALVAMWTLNAFMYMAEQLIGPNPLIRTMLVIGFLFVGAIGAFQWVCYEIDKAEVRNEIDGPAIRRLNNERSRRRYEKLYQKYAR